MASVFWKGELDCGGEIQVPVHLVAAARAEKISFSRVNPETGAGVKQHYTDASTGEVVQLKNLEKRTQFNGHNVTVTDDELKQLVAESDKTIEILEFVKEAEVDPIFYDSSYYVHPDNIAADYPYQLLAEAMASAKYAAVGRMSRGQREYLILIRSSGGALVLHTLFYASEVRPDAYDAPALGLSDDEVKLFKKFLRARSAKFDPSKYRDEFAESLNQLLESKIKPEQDMREVLKASIQQAKKKRSRRKKSS